MKTFLQVLACGAAVVAGGGFSFMKLKQPASAPPSTVRVEASPARIERGRYLFELVDCSGCHSPRDFSRFGGPAIAGKEGQGWVFPPEMGLPGSIGAPNITSDRETGIGAWTDGEIIRAVREGIGRDGRALFPLMPYTYLRSLSDEDTFALVAYLRTLPPISNRLPPTRIDFPVWFFIKSAPQPVTAPVPPPNRASRVEYGRYLANAAGCVECHTQDERGQLLPGMSLAGGRRFTLGQMTVVSANITPDEETGIGRWSEQQFVEKFYDYRKYADEGPPPVGPEAFTLMPWLNLCKLPPEDLGAILAYLKTQPAVKNAVETHPGYPAK